MWQLDSQPGGRIRAPLQDRRRGRRSMSMVEKDKGVVPCQIVDGKES